MTFSKAGEISPQIATDLLSYDDTLHFHSQEYPKIWPMVQQPLWYVQPVPQSLKSPTAIISRWDNQLNLLRMQGEVMSHI